MKYMMLVLKKKMKHLVGTEVYGDRLVVHSGNSRGRLRSNYSNKSCNYCKKNGDIKKFVISCRIGINQLLQIRWKTTKSLR